MKTKTERKLHIYSDNNYREDKGEYPDIILDPFSEVYLSCQINSPLKKMRRRMLDTKWSSPWKKPVR